MNKITKPWQAIVLGLFYTVLSIILQLIVKEKMNISLFLIILAPILFVPFFKNFCCIVLATLGTMISITLCIVISHFFLNKYSTTNWNSVAIINGIIFAVCILFALPIRYFLNRRLLKSKNPT